MKKILWLLTLTSLLSCKKLIELDPQSTASTNALYKTDKDFQDAVVGIYSTLQPSIHRFGSFGDLAEMILSSSILLNWSSLISINFLATSATPCCILPG
jgi:hypothetical protein